jgi:periplasmic nitrate reductase NapD
MPVSGVVITCTPGSSGALTPLVTAESGVTVHGSPDDSTIIAVIQSDTVQGEVDTVKRLSDMEGVQAVRLAYHNFEDLEEAGADNDEVRKEN